MIIFSFDPFVSTQGLLCEDEAKALWTRIHLHWKDRGISDVKT